MSAVVSNPKISIASSKISLTVIERFSILTINNKYAKNAPIFQFLLGILAGSISFPNYFFCQVVENLDGNNINNTDEVEEEIKLEDKR